MTQSWPDREQALLRRYVAELELDREGPHVGKPYESVLRRFQAFVMEHSAQGSLSREMVEAWLRECVNRSTLNMAVRRAQIVSGFLDWLVRGGYRAANPFAEIRCVCRRQSTAAIVRALVSPDPNSALEHLRGLPRFGSHLGPIIQAHVKRMKTLGLRYHESPFLRFDEFLQRRPGAAKESLETVVEEYAELAPSPAAHMERVKVGRAIARSLQRSDPTAMLMKRDRMIVREALRRGKKPYIFTREQLQHLFQSAKEYPSPKAPLRSLSLYTMFVLGLLCRTPNGGDRRPSPRRHSRGQRLHRHSRYEVLQVTAASVEP